MASPQDVDPLIEQIMGVRDRAGEVGGDGHLHRCQAGRLAVLAGQHVH